MSKAQLDKFIAVAAGNPALWEQASQGERDAQKFVANIVQYAKAQGYDFSEDEARAWIIEASRQRAGGELQDS